jgi:hypothetical protein
MSESLTPLQDKALKCIQEHFKESPITGHHIADAINFEETHPDKQGAAMRSVINALRTKGHPVCANGKGYYWPRNYEELEKYIEEFQNRINDQQSALNGLKIIAMKHNSNADTIPDEDLDQKIRELIKKTHLSFDEVDRQRIADLNYALKSREPFLKRATIKKYCN